MKEAWDEKVVEQGAAMNKLSNVKYNDEIDDDKNDDGGDGNIIEDDSVDRIHVLPMISPGCQGQRSQYRVMKCPPPCCTRIV